MAQLPTRRRSRPIRRGTCPSRVLDGTGITWLLPTDRPDHESLGKSASANTITGTGDHPAWQPRTFDPGRKPGIPPARSLDGGDSRTPEAPEWTVGSPHIQDSESVS